ncbi:GNAT family N-acetyltransferase [Fundidesulfovibrio terrae]|uniref:GNAT family N-acetyltransferase n=1 Tax=Fundidesulfovibrio terrae TaxID=2922866 RepID=UPI001FAF56EE|nr:GNAT family N-acetyltransferase [Fundidesulfovibrio terrae]
MDMKCLVRQQFDSDALGLDFYRATRIDPDILGRELAALPLPYMADAKAHAQDIDGAKLLMRLGFRKMCVQPTFSQDLTGAAGAACGEPMGAASMPEAELDAHAANFPFSRFGLDPDVAQAARVAHQRRWIANSMASGEILKFIEPGAFVSFKLKDKAAVIDLISVLPQARGRGSLLLGRLRSWAASKGLTRVEVTTESENVTACLFYQKNGFRLDRASVAFHLHAGAGR